MQTIKLPTLNSSKLKTGGILNYNSPLIYNGQGSTAKIGQNVGLAPVASSASVIKPGATLPTGNLPLELMQPNASGLIGYKPELPKSTSIINPVNIFNPAPTNTVSTTPSVSSSVVKPASAYGPVNQPATVATPANSYYRVGNDIYDAATNQKIPDVATWKANYVNKGGKDLGQKPAPILNQSDVNSDNLNRGATDIAGTDVGSNNNDVDSFMKSMQDQYTQAQADLAAKNTERANLIKQYTASVDKYGNYGTRQAELEKLNGVDTIQQNLNDLYSQISAKNSQFERASVDNTGRAVMTSEVSGEEALIRRQQASEVGALTSMALVVQGKLSAAKQTALDTVNMEFKPIENEINRLKTQIDLNYQDLTAAQKTEADDLKTYLDERTRVLNEAKDQRNAVLSVGLEAAKAGAPADILTKIAAAKTPGDAIKAGAGYLTANKFVAITGTNNVLNTTTGEITSANPSNQDNSFGGSLTIPTNTLAYRNNNPGNLRYVGQAGATQGEGGFAKFATPEEGYAALKAQIQLDASRGLTLGQFINKYAPPGENDTKTYISQMMQATGATENTPVSQINLDTLAAAMANKESGATLSAGQQYNNDILNSLDPIDRAAWTSASQEDRNIAQQLAEYKMDISKVASLRGNKRTQIANLAQLINPSFDINTYSQITQAKKSFAPGGKDYKNVVSLNTAIQHLKELNDASLALKNGGLQLWNSIANFGLNAVGDPRVVKFETAANAVEGEMANVFKGTGATDQEIKSWRNVISSSNSPAQLQTSINTLLDLMKGRLEALSGTYNTIVNIPGQQAPQLITDKSLKVLQDMGFGDVFSDYSNSVTSNSSNDGGLSVEDAYKLYLEEINKK